MAGEDVVYDATLDDTAVFEAYRRIVEGSVSSAAQASKAFDKMADRVDKLARGLDETGKKGKQSFEGLDKKIAGSTVNLDRLKQSADRVVESLIRIGIQAVKSFADAVAGGIELQKKAELVEISLTEIFQGNEKAAKGFLALVDQTAARIGSNRQEFRQLAKGLLPDIGDVNLTTEILQNLIILGRDAGANFQSIRIAAEEAFSGDNLKSLARRLNLGSAVRSAEEYSKTMSKNEAIARALRERIEETGLSVEATSGSLEVLGNRLQAELTDIQTLLGAAPAAELNEQISSLLKVISDNKGDIEIVVKAFGDLAARAIEIVGSGIQNILTNLDYEGVEALADNMVGVLETVKLIADILFEPDSLNNLISQTNEWLELLQEALLTGAKIVAIGKAENARVTARIEKAEEISGIPLSGELSVPFLSDEEKAQVDVAGQEAYNQVILDAIPAIDAYNEKLDENTQKIEDRRIKEEEATAADEEAAQAIIALGKAQDELADAEAKAAEAEEKIADKRKEFAKDLSRELLSINRKLQNQLIEDQIDNARDREKIALANRRKIEDIERGAAQRLEDAQEDLGKEEQKVAEKNKDKQVDISRDRTKKIAEAERDLVRALLRIREQFYQSAEEAERNNDVQAFLAAVRRKDQQVNEAKDQRDQTIEEAGIQAKESKEELKESYKKQLEDLKESNQEKLDELDKRLERELEAQQIADVRKKEDQDIAEAQASADRKRQFDIELEEFRIKESQKRADLEASLAAEFAILQTAAEAKINLARLTADEIIAENRRAFEAGFGKSVFGGRKLGTGLVGPAAESGVHLPLAHRQGGGSENQSGVRLPLIHRQEGGPLIPNRPTVVGERGPEVVIPQGPGFVIPNTFFRQPVPFGGDGQQNIFNDNRSPSINMPVGPDVASSPQMRNMIMQIARQVIAETLR